MRRFLVGWFFSLWASLACAGVPCSLPFNLQNNTTADATQVMANYNAIVTCLGNAAASGANSDITGLFGLTSPLGPTFGGANTFYGGTTAGLNSYTITVVPNTFSLTTGFMLSATIGTTNTGASTLTANGGSTINIFRATPTGPIALTGGELIAGNRALFGYDGTQWQLLSQTAQVGGYGPLTALASAATTDLGTVPTHNVQITGTAAITSFGSTANLAYPVYRITFLSSGAVLTNSASLILVSGANITAAALDSATMLYTGSGQWVMLDYQRSSGQPLIQSVISATTVQGFGTGSGTYTPTTGTRRIHVRLVGAGGGGGNGAGTTGGAGGASSFGAWTCNGGAGGAGGSGVGSAAGGAGGSGGVNGVGTVVLRVNGAAGQGGGGGGSVTAPNGGQGGSTFWGGAGAGGGPGGTNGTSATGSTGSGGGGSAGAPSANAAGGGGAGEAVEFWVQSPGALAYAVGSGGSGNTNGGSGGNGSVVIEEFYY